MIDVCALETNTTKTTIFFIHFPLVYIKTQYSDRQCVDWVQLILNNDNKNFNDLEQLSSSKHIHSNNICLSLIIHLTLFN